MARTAATLGTLLALLLAPDLAWGGCGNVCEIGEPRVRAAPEFDCVAFDTMPSECGCSLRLTVHNRCSTPLDATDFQFDSCHAATTPWTADCTTLPPQVDADFEWWLGDDGHHVETFTLRKDTVDHSVTLEVDVTAFDDGDMCSVGRPGRRQSPSSLALACVAAAVLVARRSRLGAPAHRPARA